MFSIYLLQETHCSENTTATWSSEWGYKTLFSCCSSASGGVAILFNNHFAFQLERSYSDPKGRYVISDIETNGRFFTLAPIYAPNDDDPTFFESFFSHLQDFHCDDIVLGGDFNLVLNLEKDKCFAPVIEGLLYVEDFTINWFRVRDRTWDLFALVIEVVVNWKIK